MSNTLTLVNIIECPICKKSTGKLVEHLKLYHEEKEITSAIIDDKRKGLSDAEIGGKYGVTFRQLEKIIRKATGVSISEIKNKKKIKSFFPNDFKEENTTIWSFKSRGNWATHSGEYRGNWSPYIPRNIILKYSQPEDVVLDYFVGAGTTAVEAKLLGRKCIACDINEKAIEIAKKNLDFNLELQQLTLLKETNHLRIYEPELSVRDARDLSFLGSNSIDLICAHPPYADIIQYTEHKEGDLSYLDVDNFLKEMKTIAKESYRVLKPGKKCAILIGDMRKHKHVVPLGFKLINVYLDAGFNLRELVIKRQHNCKTTGFWYANSLKFNFLLLAHEYLPIFEKPLKEISEVKEQSAPYRLIQPLSIRPIAKRKLDEFETTTVWIFPENDFENLINRNVIERYRDGELYKTVSLVSNSKKSTESLNLRKKINLLFIKSQCLDNNNFSISDIIIYLEKIKETINKELLFIKNGGYCVIQTKDIRITGHIEPLAKHIVDSINYPCLSLKEIVIVATENHKDKYNYNSSSLRIVHQYLLVYRKIEK